MASTLQDRSGDAIVPVVRNADVELAPIPSSAKNTSHDHYLVSFQIPFDAENPKDWPNGRKWAVTDVLSATGFNRIMVSTIMAPALSSIASELNMNSIESVMSLSIYVLATALGPLLIGPLSEMYGRQVVLHASNIWFLVWNIACGFANTKELLIAARFLAGFGASAIYALAGGVLGDVWRPEQRGRSLGTYLLIPLLGAAVGPIIGGFMAARTTWRWMFWATSIFQAVMVAVSFTTFKETYAPLILKKRADRLRRETGNQQYYTSFERLDEKKSVVSILGRTLTRPLRLLALHPIIQVCSAISAFYYGILYIVLTSFATLWTDKYHQSVEISGLHYIACALGEVAGCQVGGPLMDFMYRRMLKHAGTEEHVPEFRIPLILPVALLGPLGLFIYGWTAEYNVHWIAVDIGVFIYMFGGQIAGMPLQAYVMDAYPEHTSSALAASQFLRSMTAFLFPLFAPSMYNVLGYGWGNSTLAFIGLVFGIPAPLTMWFWGARLRARATSSH
ncbi:putative Efflux pump antibiotic resistance protein [Seiridium unicorne]|uniref:Efflux pump antibiotic resistance protein n=1 Tax=Seiridium unicorne TaxID=138068 RepID=A0ABR2UQ49_9PEZI